MEGKCDLINFDFRSCKLERIKIPPIIYTRQPGLCRDSVSVSVSHTHQKKKKERKVKKNQNKSFLDLENTIVF